VSVYKNFNDLIQSKEASLLQTDDILYLVLPLFRAVSQLHQDAKVANLEIGNIGCDEFGILQLNKPQGIPPLLAVDRLRQVNSQSVSSSLHIVDEVRLIVDSEQGTSTTYLDVHEDSEGPITKPAFIHGFRVWEQTLGHHDELTDIFLLGQILAALALGLDFLLIEDIKRFAVSRKNLFQINERLNPVICRVILSMTSLNRHERATDLIPLIQQLENYRYLPADLNIDHVLSGSKTTHSKRKAVLTHLRDRLFDLSRRNRLIYFKPSHASVNFTVASVPMVLQLSSVRTEQLCTWHERFAKEVLNGKNINLQNWLRFEDQPYLNSALDKVILDTRRDKNEFGFNNLRLVAAFIRWHNFKENPDERINSPLLWLSVELTKKKGVRDQYTLKCDEVEAEFNPAIRFHLKQLYDIDLPEKVDLSKVSIAEIHENIAAQIKQSEPGVELRLISKPALQLIHQKAVQRLQQFQRTRSRRRVDSLNALKPSYSYQAEDYRPLGLAIFKSQITPHPLPLRGAVGATIKPRTLNMASMDVGDSIGSIEHTTFTLTEDEGNRFAWDIDLTQVTLANFNYKKMSLVRDYSQLAEDGADNPSFDRIFSIEPRELDTSFSEVELVDQWNVVAADSTQNKAVQRARTGKPLIIQGPPGTGKSQTITNLIADYLGRGKRILFVCEKRAALDVVFHRLKQAGLSDLCCLIHDSQADKKAFVADLRESYQAWVSTADQFDHLSRIRGDKVHRLSEHLSKLAAFEAFMVNVPESIGGSVRQLIKQLINLPIPDHSLSPSQSEQLPDYAVWNSHRAVTQQLHQLLKTNLGVDSLANHVFSKLSGVILSQQNPFTDIESELVKMESHLDALDTLIHNLPAIVSEASILKEIGVLIDLIGNFESLHLGDHLSLMDSNSDASRNLQESNSQLHAINDELKRVEVENQYWTDKFSYTDTQSALALSESQEQSILRWFNADWWRLRKQLNQRYDFSQHAIRPSFKQVLTGLLKEHQVTQSYAELSRKLGTYYQAEDLDIFVREVASTKALIQNNSISQRYYELLKGASNTSQVLSQNNAFTTPLGRFGAELKRAFSFNDNTTVAELGEAIRDLRESLDDLPDLIPVLRSMHNADERYAKTLQQIAQTPAQLESIVISETLHRIYRQQPAWTNFNAVEMLKQTYSAGQSEKDLLEENANVIRATLHHQFLNNVTKSTLPAAQLDAAGKLFKKRYATGRRELEHEFAKTMRYRPIRDLAGDETGLVLNDLKPVWLMSPLSVSDTLPLRTDLFDVVIFDEASQIPIEEGVPALSRAKQVIVVGDEMQLPPTNFFSASNDEAKEVDIEEDGDTVSIELDAESLLNQAAKNLPATMLAWHYRSRYESLISFSNAAFYNGQLITIPDVHIPTKLLSGHSPQDHMHDLAGVDKLMSRPISFHHLEHGIYADRTNPAEAKYIAEIVRDLLLRQTGLSIGVVAFSEAQQTEVEQALRKLADSDTQFSTLLDNEFNREEGDQFCGLFVKNLENVQGDERDIIILSICYARNAEGKMHMNFGPINMRGGEKRLNVIFSRARHHMAVISSIKSDSVTNIHNEGANALKTFLQYAEASSQTEFDRSQSILNTINGGVLNKAASHSDSCTMRFALTNALRQRGHEVHERVGRSQFRCDLAIVGKKQHGYILGILLDTQNSPVAFDARDRYVFRPEILRNFGWTVVDIPSHDWIKSPERVIQLIEKALTDYEELMVEHGLAKLQSHQVAPTEALKEEAAPVDTTQETVKTGPNDLDALEAVSQNEVVDIAEDAKTDTSLILMRRFIFKQGTSDKFWQIAVNGLELIVEYGRVGTKGQRLTKTFESDARVNSELAKLINEKTKKGYVEDSQ
jgi:predicted DNA-binding WGR domain protein/DNA polymerase III delta prime subunit